MGFIREHILHVDMNAFFASCEQARRPELRGRPVIVCGDPSGRGVVSAASYEARKFGVRSAMPALHARRLCPHGVFVSGDMSLYSSVSKAIFADLRQYTPIVAEASIDEAFLDVKGCEIVGTPVEIALRIKRHIREKYALTCSIGIAENRLLAKMASDMQKPDGLVVLKREDVPQLMWPLPVGRLYGVGQKTEQSLRSVGIITIGDLARAPESVLSEMLGVYGKALTAAARGEGDPSLDTSSHIPKSISHETTFDQDVADMKKLRRVLLSMCDKVAFRLRSSGLQAKTVSIKYRLPDFRTYTRAKRLDGYVDTSEPLIESAVMLLEQNLTRGTSLRLLGVAASSLIDASVLRQASLLPEDTAAPVYGALDVLREKFGQDAVIRGSKLKDTTRRRK